MSTAANDKGALRKLIRARLSAMPAADRAAQSTLLRERFLASPLLTAPDAGPVMLYAGSDALAEPDLDPLIDALAAKGYIVCVPRMDPGTRTLVPVPIASPLELAPDPEQPNLRTPPASTAPIDPHTLSMVVLPGLGFDEHLNRLGRGAGYYDRFLASLSQSIKRLALAFDEQIVERVPVDAFDQPLNAIVTPTRNMP